MTEPALISRVSPSVIEISDIIAIGISAGMWLVFVYRTGIHHE
ncbi:hypothetical protein ACTXJ2_13445 [Psychrobacter alimentarius]|nr:hypothetical protein [Psychrobacter sp. JB193]